MDTLTHALSGALVARILSARRVTAAASAPPTDPDRGRLTAPWDGLAGAPKPWQCVLVGLVAGAFPDSDAITQLWGDVTYLLHHRGATHSALLLPLWAWLVAWVMSKLFAVTRAQKQGWKSLYAVALLGIAIHIAGDWITQFGTMLLAPVSNARFGLGAMFIIDLVFTGTLLAGCALAALLPRARWPAAAALLVASGWVVLAWVGMTEAQQAGLRKAQSLGLAPGAATVIVMPRPASPFNWTVSVFDGSRYHVAHLNTRRKEALVATDDDHFVRRFSAPYLPESQATWTVVPQFGPAGTPEWVRQAWTAPRFDFFRWFALTPALLQAVERPDGTGAIQRCAVFRDLRFEFPGRDEGPFRYAVCLGAGGAAEQIYGVTGDAWERVR